MNMHTITYLIPAAEGASFDLVVLCTPNRVAAFATWAALRASPRVRGVRVWVGGRIAG